MVYFFSRVFITQKGKQCGGNKCLGIRDNYPSRFTSSTCHVLSLTSSNAQSEGQQGQTSVCWVRRINSARQKSARGLTYQQQVF
ncbi:hypothetical protein HanIR_Chr03g0135321 [Helianthus annuus]|nr:hypothetical protein HanIR_Chr03g0135321 [Helianthus annuus]